MWARRKRGGADSGIIEISRTKGRNCFEAFALYLHPKNFQNEFHRSDYRRSRILDDRGIPPDSNQSRIPLRHEMLVGISPRWVVRLRGLAADQPLHIVNPARGLRVLLLLEHTGSLSAEETGGERVVPGKSQTQEIARPSLTAQRPLRARDPYCAKLILLRIQFVRENLVLPNQSFTNPVLYGRPRPCRTK